MRFLAISLLTVFIVSALVLAGVPMYNAWASTGHCLHGSGHTELDSLDPWYPCGHEFGVWHYGTGGSGSCDCDHSVSGVDLVIHDQLKTTEYVRQSMSQSDTSSCATDDATEWCARVHVPAGTWYYTFECQSGSESLYGGSFTESSLDCEYAEWDSSGCD